MYTTFKSIHILAAAGWLGGGFEEPWVVAGLVGVIGGAVVGARFLGPLNGQIADAASAAPVDHARLEALRSRLLTVAVTDVTILVLIVVLMVWKPTFG